MLKPREKRRSTTKEWRKGEGGGEGRGSERDTCMHRRLCVCARCALACLSLFVCVSVICMWISQIKKQPPS